jgi:predicted ester cyclase
MMNGAFPDVVVTEEDLIASGDRVVERSSAVATYKGSMMGEKPRTNASSGPRFTSTALRMERFRSIGLRSL